MRALIPVLLLALIVAGGLYLRRSGAPHPAPAGPLPSLQSPGKAHASSSTSPSLDEAEPSGASPTAPSPTASAPEGTLAPGPPAVGATAASTPDLPRRITRVPTIEERSEELVEELLEQLELDPSTMGALTALLEERLLWRSEAAVAPPTDDERQAKDAALEASLVELYGDDFGEEVLQQILAADL